MRLAKILFFVAIAVTCASGAHAALVFNTDFAQDGRYDVTWPMKAGETVAVDIYVSNVPEPGLFAIGFKLTYDATKLSVEGAVVDTGNWPSPPNGPYIDLSVPGEIDMAGYRDPLLSGLYGDDHRLATVIFRCSAEDTSDLMLIKRGAEVEGFVLDCPTPPCDPASLVLDGDIGTGVILATILPATPGDTNGDGNITLADAILVLQMLTRLQPGYVHANADVDNNGVIGLQEVFYILQSIAAVR